jgi:hypothetical protein
MAHENAVDHLGVADGLQQLRSIVVASPALSFNVFANNRAALPSNVFGDRGMLCGHSEPVTTLFISS